MTYRDDFTRPSDLMEQVSTNIPKNVKDMPKTVHSSGQNQLLHPQVREGGGYTKSAGEGFVE
ncbi:MAG: hypothetical protein ABIJ65_08110 [Chloroflexota bacterium]